MPRDPELARRINLLFDVMHRRGETPLSTAAAAAAMTAHAGAGVTMAALEELRLGNSAAASRAELDVIAEFFGVPVCYLTNTRVRTGIDAQLHLVKVMRDAGDLRPVQGSTLPALADTEGDRPAYIGEPLDRSSGSLAHE